eukprot:scaffold98063_cov23-Attheya_sp.AAC.1
MISASLVGGDVGRVLAEELMDCDQRIAIGFSMDLGYVGVRKVRGGPVNAVVGNSHRGKARREDTDTVQWTITLVC